MNALGTLLSGPLAHAIGWALVHLLWQGILVAAILAATLALMQRRSPNARPSRSASRTPASVRSTSRSTVCTSPRRLPAVRP